MRALLLTLAVAAAPVPAARAQRLERIEPCVLAGVRVEPSVEAPRLTLVLRDGRIAGILRDEDEAPAGARRIDAEGLYAAPAFVDAFTSAGCEGAPAREPLDAPPPRAADVPVEMRAAGRKGLHPTWSAVEHLELTDAELQSRRAEGFALLHVAPGGNLLGGRSALITTRDAALRERVLVPAAFQCATFAARGEGYPSTRMGYLAQLRQLFLDARRHELLRERYAAGQLDLRPPYDPDLVAARAIVAGEERLLCHADSARDIERWLSFGDEVGASVVVAGGREAWRVADLLAARGTDVILTLDWGEEVPEPEAPAADEGAPAHYVEPLELRRERRRRWLEGRDCALRLHDAGLRFAFGSGEGPAEELLDKVRELVAAGLPAEVALRALSSNAAEILGVERRVGRIEVGLDADLALWSGPPTAPESRARWLVVDGVPYELEADGGPSTDGAPEDGVDATGTWQLDFESEEASPARLELSMEPAGEVTGRFETTSPVDGSSVSGGVSGTVSGDALRLTGSLSIGGFNVELVLHGTLEEERMSGEVTWTASSGEQRSAFSARRAPDRPEDLR